ncbi:MAG: single-stranded DNA-binding protein, partial [Rhodococcus sp. (in: high G+C Gram-positive bacteria)]
TGEWTDGGTLFLTVTCWRRLVKGVGGSLMKGDPIIAYGQLRTNEYTTREGVERSALEMTASAVGPDLARCIVKVERARPATETTAEADADTPQDDAYDSESVVGIDEFEAAEGAHSDVEEPTAVGAGV